MTTTTPLAVTAADRARWQRALLRDEGHGRWLQEERVRETGDSFYAHYAVESLRARKHDDLPSHDVHLIATITGVSVTCTCPWFAVNHAPCVHTALVIDKVGYWPFALWEQPAPTPPNDYRCEPCNVSFASGHEAAHHLIWDHSDRLHPGAALLLNAKSRRERMAGVS